MGLLDRFSFDTLLAPLNRFFDVYTGGGRRPVLFDIDRTRPELRRLDREAGAIREEVLALLPRKAELPRYHELDAQQTYISAPGGPDRSWRIFYLSAMGERPASSVAACPRTSALLEGIPGMFQAFFSILEAGKSIPPHNGPYRGYLRYHLGLVVPGHRPPSLRISDQVITWREGESFLFDDSWNHEVVNESDEDRVILIVDIRRPMPFPFGTTNRVAQAVMRQLYGKEVLKKLA